jgi:hypothetical protein
MRRAPPQRRHQHKVGVKGRIAAKGKAVGDSEHRLTRKLPLEATCGLAKKNSKPVRPGANSEAYGGGRFFQYRCIAEYRGAFAILTSRL